MAMASSTEPQAHHHRHRHHPINAVSCFIQSTATNFSSLFTPKTMPFVNPPSFSPILFNEPPPQSLSLPVSTLFESTQGDSASSKRSSLAANSVSPESNSRFPSTVRISGLKSSGKGSGPAFVGQVFSMCDLSGTGLMAVTTHFDIPFISKRTPQWLKKTFAALTKSERKGPVFRFFMDLGDAVSYVKRLNIRSGVVGACRLDLAYEHFKEQPHLFQFVPNEKQVKEANKLLKLMPQSGQRKKVDGVPVFSAENLDIAIATMDGIKWYTPYFFDKNMLDNILEESVDQHFNTLIQSRHLQRRRDIVDDNLAAEAFEEIGESAFEPPEVQEVMDEIGLPGIPLSAISKAAEIELLYAVDKALLGNRWLRKAVGIQPKFPYAVDSFEKRSAASFQRASEPAISGSSCKQLEHLNTSAEFETKNNVHGDQGYQPDFRFPFGDWLTHPRLEAPKKNHKVPEKRRENTSREYHGRKQETDSSRFLPKITMVGISTGEGGQVSKTALKKSMEELTRELERTEQGNMANNSNNNNDTKEFTWEDRDPLFVANVGDSYAGMSKSGSARWVRSGAN